jgi:hypothetical protein
MLGSIAAVAPNLNWACSRFGEAISCAIGAPAENVDHGCRLAAVACADEIVESLID